MDWMAEVQYPVRATHFSLLNGTQTGTGIHRTPYRTGIEDSFPGGKAVVA
jgi:hypothetical protein